MEDTVTVKIPASIPHMLNRTPEEIGRDLRLYAALMLFRLGKLSSGAAAEMAGVPRVM
jgi:predicted HTH domain antitoxin